MGRVRNSESAAVLLLAASLVLVACSPRTQPSGLATNTPEVSPMALGWISLFDGTSTAELRGYGQDSFPASWVVEDGELRAVPGAGVDLITNGTFTDFVLEFEWRLGEAGNSGVMYRVIESDAPSWASGPEYQVLDDEAHPDGRDPRTSAASLYGLIAPNADKRLEPVGSYNVGRIVVRDGHVEHWLNDRLVLTYDWASPDVRALVAASKFRDMPRFMTADGGAIVLQHHGEEVWFRMVRIREA
jgi:hypothetical protein